MSSVFATFVAAGVIVLAAAAYGGGLPRGEPEEQGMSSERLSQIPAAIGTYVEEGKLAGVVTLVARRGRIVHRAAIGDQNAAVREPMREDTIFRIYSMTKPVTAVAALILMEEGRLLPSDPVAKHLPEFAGMRVYKRGTADAIETEPAGAPITIRHLLTHTAGLTYPFLPGPVADLYQRAAIPGGPRIQGLGTTESESGPKDLRELTAALARMPLLAHPGTEWHYGMSLDVLGRIVEVVSGQSLGEFFRRRILGPLEMRDTAFYVPDDKLDRFAAVYVRGPDGSLGAVDDPRTSVYRRPPPIEFGGSGLVSTASDYARFAQMLLGGGRLGKARILGPRTVRFMLSNHLTRSETPREAGRFYSRLGPGRPWGMGFGLAGSVVTDPARLALPVSEGVYGWAGAASTHFWIDPEEELVGIVLAQLIPDETYPLRELMQVLTYQAIIR